MSKIYIFFILIISLNLHADVSYSKDTQNKENNASLNKSTSELQSLAIVKLIGDIDLMQYEIEGLKKELANMREGKSYKENNKSSLMQSYIVVVSSANVRGGPGKDFKIIDYLKKGRVFDVVEKKGLWYKIKYSGFIHSSIIKPYNR